MKYLFISIVLLCGGFSVAAQQLPDFYINDIQNNAQSFEDLKGDKLTLFDFWAT